MTTNTNYDTLYEKYRYTKSNVVKKYSETFSFFEILGNIQGKTILDLACGDGYYTRYLKKKGGTRIVGVDLSAKMIEVARQAEEQQPMGIEYRVGDVAQMGVIGSFDIVTAVYLFTYASSQDMLTTMCHAIAKNLASSGRLVAVTFNPNATTRHLEVAKQYGTTLTANDLLQDGSTIQVRIQTPVGDVHLVNYHWTQSTYERALQDAGFKKITWHPVRVSDDGLIKLGQSYWQAHLDAPGLIVLECCK